MSDKSQAMECINKLLSMENNLDAKLNMLTSIGLDTTNDEVFWACEEIRNWLPELEEAEGEKNVDALLSRKVIGTFIEDSTGEEGPNETTGDNT